MRDCLKTPPSRFDCSLALLTWVGLRQWDLIPLDRWRPLIRTTRQFSITLPNEMADVVKTKFAAGEYATESEVGITRPRCNPI